MKGHRGAGSASLPAGVNLRDIGACLGFLMALKRFVRRTGFVLLALALLSVLSPGWATTYEYDGNGRLRTVTIAGGTSATYNYDSRGNLVSIASEAKSQLFIGSFAPNNGMPGDTVTIWGGGFSIFTSGNTVKFNGISAPVITASATQLVVTVPQNAVAGSAPITVTRSGTTVSSIDNFTVTSVGDPPSITSFVDVQTGTTTTSGSGPLNPDTLTITGKNLYPVSGATAVQIDGIYVFPTQISNTQIQLTIPPYVASGPITVTTPYGTVTTSNFLFVLPTNWTPSITTTYSTPLIPGASPQTVNLTTSVPYGVMLFQGNVGDYFTLQSSSFSGTATSVGYSVYSPVGVLIANSIIRVEDPSVDLPPLNETGMYTVYFWATNSTATFSIALEKNLLLTADGTSVNVPTTLPGQSKRLIFVASPGDNLGLGLTNIVTAGGGINNVRVIQPHGNVVWNTVFNGPLQTVSCSAQCSMPLFALPVAGTYAILFTPGMPTTTFSVTTTLSKASVTPLPAANAPTTPTPTSMPTLNVAGVAGMYTFTGTAGQKVALQISATGSNYVYVVLGNPDLTPNGAIGTQPVSTPKTFNFTLPQNATASKPYQLWVWLANNGGVPSANVTASLAVTAAPIQVTTAGPQTVSNVLGGQIETFTFQANAGDSLGLGLSNVSVAGGGAIDVVVNQPDTAGGGQIWNSVFNGWQQGTCSPPQCNFSLFALPATGLYKVTITPNSPTTTFSLTANLSAASVTSLPAVSAPATPTPTTMPTLSPAGAIGMYTFTGTAGQNVTLQITPTGNTIGVVLVNPDQTGNGSINPQWVSATKTFNFTLPQNGTASTPYRLWVWLGNGGLPSANVTASLAVTAAPIQVTTAGPQTVSNVLGGQIETFTFQANTGDNLGLGLSNVSVAGGGAIDVVVNQPDTAGGGQIWNSVFNGWQLGTCAPPQCNFSLFALPATGLYKVTITPNSPTTTFSVTANLSAASVTVLPATNAATAMPTLSPAGAIGMYTFTGTAGQNVTLQITPTGNTIGVVLVNPDQTGNGSINPQWVSATQTFNFTLPQNATASTPYRLWVWLGNGGLPSASVTAKLH